jgi:hypothetical protein
MSEWLDVQVFGDGDIQTLDGKPYVPTLPVPVAPIITLDFLLEDQNDAVITDQYGDPVSLKGLAFYPYSLTT